MKHISIFYLLLLVSLNSILYPQASTRKGWWKFDDTNNLLKAEQNFGKDLTLIGTHQAIEGPDTGNGAVKIGIGSHYKMSHGILPNGGGVRVNEYSIQIDFKIESKGIWHTFFQTTVLNNDDADCAIDPDGKIGIRATGYSEYSVKVNEWYRLVISVKNGIQFNYYLDGQLLKNGDVQAVDGRFALDSLLLMFADEDGEDNDIIVSEIGIWDTALSAIEVSNLGGFGHQVEVPPTQQLILVPYLQTPTTNSIFICWHDTLSTFTNVEYGMTPALGQSTVGTNEIVTTPYRWHYVKLTGLEPFTEYYYKAVSGSGSSDVYSFRTLPDSNFTGKIRFLLLSDTHSTDTIMAVKVIKEAKKKIQQLYGNDIQNQINVVLHSGDLVVDGSNIIQWTDQYFAPMFPISPNIPFMTITGNHEGENQNYYKYMHYDDVTPYVTAAERFWSFRIANTLFIGLNSNASSFFTLQKIWLNQALAQAEADSTIDFVFVISHHFAITELWGEGMTYGAGPNYISTQIYPILKKYSKVIQHSYGHTHGFERGTVESEAVNSKGDFRVVCGGGGGGFIDRWGVFLNHDFSSIQISIDNYFYQIVEIDAANKTFESTMYSLGNSSIVRDNETMDKWYKKVNQSAPADPVTYAPTMDTSKITLNTSSINADSLMTAKIQIADNENFITTIIDSMIHWKNIYGVDSYYNPIDLNNGLDLTKLSFNSSRFTNGKLYYYRVKYRDHNLKWSNWSNVTSFNAILSIEDNSIPLVYDLKQNFPNPFNPSTVISYQLAVGSQVTLKIYDVLGNEVATLVNQEQTPGEYEVEFNPASSIKNPASGIYFYQLKAGTKVSTKKLVLLK